MSSAPLLVETLPRGLARPPRGLVLVHSGDTEAIDWSSWELDEEEDMGQTPDHDRIATLFESCLNTLIELRAWRDVFIAKDTFFAWVSSRPSVRVSPDVYLVRSPLRPVPSSWQTWTVGHKPPDFALEVVSEDRTKEYVVNPEKYASLGAGELVIFDPKRIGKALTGVDTGPISRYTRAPDGAFVASEVGVDRAYSSTLHAWLVVADGPNGVELRISHDAAGLTLVPTRTEAYHAERAARLEAEATIAELRAELARRSDTSST